MYTLPQEIEVWYVIPAIRKELAKCLVKEHETSYEKTGDLLGVTKAAVSQYINNKRAGKVKLDPKVMPQIDKSAKLLIKKKSDAISEISKILKVMREKHIPCEVCNLNTRNELHCRKIYINTRY